MEQVKPDRDYERIAAAIRYLTDNRIDQPGLDELAAQLGLSPSHCQRLFRRFAGVSPKQFLQFLTVDYARRRLDESASVLDAALESGLSGPGRLHDHFVVLEGMTPGEYKHGGSGLTVGYGFTPTPFGTALLAWTPRGLCAFEFLAAGEQTDAALARLEQQYPDAEFVADPVRAEHLVTQGFGGLTRPGETLRLQVRGTNFQLRVWQALLSVPPGCVISYGDLAARIGAPRAARAVGTAVGANPVAFLIPCHRVIRRLGMPGEYRWGATRKRGLLAWEAAQFAEPERRAV